MKIADLIIPDFVRHSQQFGRCPMCDYEFIPEESIMLHFIDNHLEFIYQRLEYGKNIPVDK